MTINVADMVAGDKADFQTVTANEFSVVPQRIARLIPTISVTNGVSLTAEANKFMLGHGETLKIAVVLRNVSTNTLAIEKSYFGSIVLYSEDGKPVPRHSVKVVEYDRAGVDDYGILASGQSVTGVLQLVMGTAKTCPDGLSLQDYSTEYLVTAGAYVVQVVRREKDLPLIIQERATRARTIRVEDAMGHAHFSGTHMSSPMPLRILEGARGSP